MTQPSESPQKKLDENGQNNANKRVTNEGWIHNLARRSSGLPADESRPTSTPEKNSDANLWRLAGLGVQFAGTVAIFAFMGNALDKKMGWSPWGLIGLCLIAIVGNLYLLIKELLKQDRVGKTPPNK